MEFAMASDNTMLGADLMSGLMRKLTSQIGALQSELSQIESTVASKSGLEKAVKALISDSQHLELALVADEVSVIDHEGAVDVDGRRAAVAVEPEVAAAGAREHERALLGEDRLEAAELHLDVDVADRREVRPRREDERLAGVQAAVRDLARHRRGDPHASRLRAREVIGEEALAAHHLADDRDEDRHDHAEEAGALARAHLHVHRQVRAPRDHGAGLGHQRLARLQIDAEHRERRPVRDLVSHARGSAHRHARRSCSHRGAPGRHHRLLLHLAPSLQPGAGQASAALRAPACTS